MVHCFLGYICFKCMEWFSLRSMSITEQTIVACCSSPCLYEEECASKETRLSCSENTKVVTMYDLVYAHTDMKTTLHGWVIENKNWIWSGLGGGLESWLKEMQLRTKPYATKASLVLARASKEKSPVPYATPLILILELRSCLLIEPTAHNVFVILYF